MSGCLYMVGTPIGNLGDMSPRVAEAFRAADAICCEDTRVTSKLLAHLGISKTLVRCDENVIAQRAPELVDRLLAGETLAFASDAGMPSVSDPGQVLVDAARDAGVDVQVIPGPSACVTALVASGISCEHFFFEGFLPRKHGERVRRLSAARCAARWSLSWRLPLPTRWRALQCEQTLPTSRNFWRKTSPAPLRRRNPLPPSPSACRKSTPCASVRCTRACSPCKKNATPSRARAFVQHHPHLRICRSLRYNDLRLIRLRGTIRRRTFVKEVHLWQTSPPSSSPRPSTT